MRPRGSIEGEAELFTGGDSDWVGDIRRLQDLGVTSVDVRLFGYGEAQTLQGTIDNIHRFRDGVLDAITILGNHEEIFLGAAGVRARSRAEVDQPYFPALPVGRQPERASTSNHPTSAS